MTNETTTSILEYADTHLKFSMEDLFAYLHKKIGINKSSLAWYLFKLVNENKLVRTGRGMYARILKPSFAPQPAEEVKEVYDLLTTHFPFAKFCIYQGEIIAPLQHHLSPNRIIYVETDRGTAETVFHLLKDDYQDVYLRPNKEMIYRYVDMDSRVFIRSSLTAHIGRTYTHVGKTIGGHIERCGLLLSAR